MSGSNKLYYATCRINARMTQDEAISHLNLSDSAMLSRYENGHVVPDQALVARMVEVYGVPSLALWHLGYANPALASWLPEVTALSTDGDIYLEAERTSDIVGDHVGLLKEVLSDELFVKDSDKAPAIRNGFKRAASKSLSIVSYIDDHMKMAQ